MPDRRERAPACARASSSKGGSGNFRPRFRNTIPWWRIHSSARKHGIADEDIEHAIRHALAIDDQDDDTRLYLGPARSAGLLEVVTIVRESGSELAIHAMKMRPKYRRLLPGD